MTLIQDTLPQWRDYLATLAETEQLVGLLADPTDAGARQEAYKLFFLSLASGYLSTFGDPDAPDFVPLVNSHYNSVGTNPDFVYGYTQITAGGQYRLSGYRGDGLFLLFDFSAGGLGVLDELGPSVGVLDADTLTIGANGAFEVLLSAERPADYTGDWFLLDPRATTINIRQAAYDWGAGNEARLAIERLDRTIAHRGPDAEGIARRLAKLAAYPQRYASFALSYVKGQRERGLINRLEHDDWAGRGGLAGQHYYQGLFRLGPGEALILETALPERVRYWNVQLNDPFWNSIDWFNHQSSLNGGQAQIDSDGLFRAVISVEDPGIPNWLDPAGKSEGSLMLRWTEASSGPEPRLHLVQLAELKNYLPSSTPSISPEKRAEALRFRRRAAQLRRRW